MNACSNNLLGDIFICLHYCFLQLEKMPFEVNDMKQSEENQRDNETMYAQNICHWVERMWTAKRSIRLQIESYKAYNSISWFVASKRRHGTYIFMGLCSFWRRYEYAIISDDNHFAKTRRKRLILYDICMNATRVCGYNCLNVRLAQLSW